MFGDDLRRVTGGEQCVGKFLLLHRVPRARAVGTDQGMVLNYGKVRTLAQDRHGG